MGKKRVEIVKSLIRDKFDGNQAKFAKEIKRSPSQVSQWLTGVRDIGDGSARNIENSLSLPRGYMDSVTGQEPPAKLVELPFGTSETVAAYQAQTGSELDAAFEGLEELTNLEQIPAKLLAAVIRDAKRRVQELLTPARELPDNFFTPNTGEPDGFIAYPNDPVSVPPIMEEDIQAQNNKKKA